jgi:RHS repeat-associated protein
MPTLLACSYDKTGWISRAVEPYGTLEWTYDKVGNRISEKRTVGATVTTENYAYPMTNNRISDVKRGTTTVRAFSYDAARNMTRDTRGTVQYNYAYNNRGRLSQALIGTTMKGNYRYDGFERLALREVVNATPNSKTHFIHDTDDNLIGEYNGVGLGAGDPNTRSLREYIYLPNPGGVPVPVAVLDLTRGGDDTGKPVMYHVMTDHLARPIWMHEAGSSSTDIVWKASYEPFGSVVSITGSLANGEGLGTQRFPGQFFQLETGLAYNWHRHYDASLGRYTQVDPIGLAGGVSVFG